MPIDEAKPSPTFISQLDTSLEADSWALDGANNVSTRSSLDSASASAVYDACCAANAVSDIYACANADVCATSVPDTDPCSSAVVTAK